MAELRVLEFFAGIGGNRLGLELAASLVAPGVAVTTVGAIEVNDRAAMVYRANFEPQQPQPEVESHAEAQPSEGKKAAPKKQKSAVLQRRVEDVPVAQVNKLAADVWLMSPPCQPFSRQGHQQGLDDPRSDALKYITATLLPSVTKRPRLIYVENVLGFEGSPARDALVAALQRLGYRCTEHLFSPHEGSADRPGLRWPNSRLRYYMTAALTTSTGRSTEDAAPAFAAAPLSVGNALLAHMAAHRDAAPATTTSLPRTVGPAVAPDFALGVRTIADVVAAASDAGAATSAADLAVPPEVLCKVGMLLDIAAPADARSCCFTKGYGKKVEGSGSVLLPDSVAGAALTETFAAHEAGGCALRAHRMVLKALAEGDAAPAAPEGAVCPLAALGLRFLSPQEALLLMGFPRWYTFPPDVTARQSWMLVGNSVHCLAVAAVLAEALPAVLSPPTTD